MRIDPDGYLHRLWQNNPETLEDCAAAVLARARQLSDTDWQMRALLKKARLPRLAKALG